MQAACLNFMMALFSTYLQGIDLHLVYSLNDYIFRLTVKQ